MSALLSAVGEIVTAAVGWVGKWAGLFTQTVTSGDTTVLANPILMVGIGLAVAGFGIGVLKRLFNVGR